MSDFDLSDLDLSDILEPFCDLLGSIFATKLGRALFVITVVILLIVFL